MVCVSVEVMRELDSVWAEGDTGSGGAIDVQRVADAVKEKRTEEPGPGASLVHYLKCLLSKSSYSQAILNKSLIFTAQRNCGSSPGSQPGSGNLRISSEQQRQQSITVISERCGLSETTQTIVASQLSCALVIAIYYKPVPKCGPITLGPTYFKLQWTSLFTKLCSLNFSVLFSQGYHSLASSIKLYSALGFLFLFPYPSRYQFLSIPTANTLLWRTFRW